MVATPIGNLDDLSPRAREVLGRADLIAAEDTRVTGRLLSYVGIKVRSLALHEHNEEKVVPRPGHNFFFIVFMQRQRPNLDTNIR